MRCGPSSPSPPAAAAASAADCCCRPRQTLLPGDPRAPRCSACSRYRSPLLRSSRQVTTVLKFASVPVLRHKDPKAPRPFAIPASGTALWVLMGVPIGLCFLVLVCVPWQAHAIGISGAYGGHALPWGSGGRLIGGASGCRHRAERRHVLAAQVQDRRQDVEHRPILH